VAKVRLSFEAWKEGNVAPATLEVPIVEAKTKPVIVERRQRPVPKVADSKELRQTLPHEGYIGGLAYTPDGRLLATLDWDRQGGNTGVHLWDAATGKKQATFDLKPKNSEVFSVQIDPKGERLAVGTREVKVSADDHRYEGWRGWGVMVWDIATGKEKAVYCEEKPGTVKVLALDENSLLISLQEGDPWTKGPKSSLVMRVDLANGEKTVIYESKDRECYIVAVSPDRRLALLMLRPSAQTVTTEARLLDLRSGKTRPFWEVRGSVSTAGAFTPDGKSVAVFLWNKLRFWDVASGRERTELSDRYAAFWKRTENERLGRILNLRFSPDGKLLAVAHEVLDIPSRRGITEIVIWNPATGEARPILRGHTNDVFWTAFAPDGRTLATGGYDKMVKLWDLSAITNGGSRNSAGK
jgi:WD40 repeat protein